MNATPTDTTPTITTSDLPGASWLAVHLPFVEAVAGPDGRAEFIFSDPDGRGDALLGRFMRDQELQRLMLWRARLARAAAMLQDGRQRVDVNDLARPRERR
jgi:hypothetical protein